MLVFWLANIAWYGLWQRLQSLNRRVARTRTPLGSNNSHRLGKKDRALKDKSRRPIAIIGFSLFAVSLLLHLTTFINPSLVNLQFCMPFMHIGMFPLFFLFVFKAAHLRQARYRFWQRYFEAMPKWTKYLLGFFGMYAFVNFALFFLLSEGATPAISNGMYILQSHGSFVREITASEYLWQQAYILRGFSGHWMIFYLIPALYFWFSVNDAGQIVIDQTKNL